MPMTWQVSARSMTLSNMFCNANLFSLGPWKEHASMPAFQNATFNPLHVALPSCAAALSGLEARTAATRGVRERDRSVAMGAA